MQNQRHASAGERRMCRKAEQLLYAQRDAGTAFGLVVDGGFGPGRGGEVRRRFDLQPAEQLMVELRVQRPREVLGADFGEAGP